MLVAPSSEIGLKTIASIARRMGYRAIGVDVDLCPPSLLKEGSKSAPRLVLFPAKRIRASSPAEAKAALRGLGRQVIVIGIPENRETFRFMSRDSRFDFVEASPELVSEVDSGEAGLLTLSGAYLSFSLKNVVGSYRGLHTFGELVARCRRLSIPLRLYSTAGNEFEMWHPRQVYFLLKLFGAGKEVLLESLSLPAISEKLRRVSVQLDL